MVRDVNLGVRMDVKGGKQARDEFQRLRKGVDATSRGFGAGARGADRYNRAQADMERQVRSTGRSFLAAHEHHLKYLGGLASTAALVQLARSSNRAGLALEETSQRFAAATDSGAAAAAEMAFMRAEADRLALDIESLQRPHSGFLVALKGTTLEGQAARDVLTGVGTAARVLSLRGEDLRGVFTALEQIVSKGTVSAEELRGQLGERLPGAFQAAARAMGVTEEALDDMLRKGELAAADLLPALAAEFQRTFGPSLDSALGGNVAALAEFNNAALDFRETLSEITLDLEVGLKGAAAPALRLLADNLEDVAAVAGGVAAGALTLWAGRAAAGAVAANRAALAAAALSARLLAFAGPAAAGALAWRGLLAALTPLAGPAGLAILAAGGVAALTQNLISSRAAARDAALGIDEYTQSLSRLTLAEAIDETDDLIEEIERGERKLSQLEGNLERSRLLSDRQRARRGLSAPEELEVEIFDLERLLQRYGERVEAIQEFRRRLVSGEDPAANAQDDPAANAQDDPAASSFDKEIERITDRLRRRRLATEEGVRESYRRERFLLQTLYGERSDVVLALESEYDEKIAAFRDERARAAAEAAEREAEALGQSGVPALEQLAAANDKLAGSEIRSRSALERERRERELGIQVKDAYAGATDEVLEKLVEEHLRTDDLLRSQGLQLELLERYGPAMVDYSDRLGAANELLESGALSAGQYARAIAEINIAAGEGSFADGWIAELERVREASKNAFADIGASAARSFGPDGTVVSGLADATAGAILFGESARKSFGDIGKQAVRQFTAELVKAVIQALLLRVAASFFGIPPAAAGPINVSGLVGGTKLGDPGAGFSLTGFAAGGVVDRPTFFGFSGQRQVGVSGEAGAEAILPLVRGPSGDLGVRAEGAGRDSARPVNVNISISAVDAAGVDELLRERRMQIAGMVREALADEGRSL